MAILTALGGNVPNFTGNAKSVMRLAFARTVASLCEDRPHTFAWDSAHCMDEDSFVILQDAGWALTRYEFDPPNIVVWIQEGTGVEYTTFDAPHQIG